MGEDGGEQAFTGDEALARPQQLAHEPAITAAGPITEDGGHLDRGILPHEGPRLGDRAFARVQFDLDELQFLSLDLEIDIVRQPGAGVMGPGTGHVTCSIRLC